jgi:DNA invertase Pin-like site-specific DNA recombinase
MSAAPSLPGKIAGTHLERLAVVYVRQSSLAQVREHGESTARQYALAEEAARLGWSAEQIVVIDADLGLSGRDGCGRAGFKELVGRVCVGEVGAIFGLEVSRLARSSADLQRLLELCSLTETLIVDADGIYDLGSFNDRLLLGLKGTMAETELHLLAGRLQGARRAAAARGELRFPLPVGYVYDEEGATVFDPDEEVRAAIADLFACFEQTGSAYAVVGVFAERPFPVRAYGGAWAGELRWGRLSHRRVTSVLQNPAYAGAYVFGRRRDRRQVEADGTIRARTEMLPREQWQVLIHDHHPGYISWQQFLQNGERLARNYTHAGARPAREGSALLQGIVRCGGCGRAMATGYPGGRPRYECAYSRADRAATAACAGVMAAPVDRAVAERLLAAVAPEQIALALAAADEVADRRGRTSRALQLRAERCRYQAARAERAFHQCDPDNRLVARSLERRWEEKLRELAEAEQGRAAQAAEPELPGREQLEALARDLPALWGAPATSDRDRKRLLRALIADVTLSIQPTSSELQVGIRWRSGASEQLTVLRPTAARTQRREAALELVRRLGPSHSDRELAAALTAAGLTTGADRPFDETAVGWLRWRNRIPPPPVRVEGELAVHELAERLGTTPRVVYSWINRGQLHARRSRHRRYAIPFNPEVERACRQRLATSRNRARTQSTAAGGAV